MLVCDKCKSDEIHVQAWVTANGFEFVEMIDENMGWCESCGATTKIVYRPDSLVAKWRSVSNNDREFDNTAGSDSTVVEPLQQ